jgi:tetratricopeptide (TPR) repeat protein
MLTRRIIVRFGASVLLASVLSAGVAAGGQRLEVDELLGRALELHRAGDLLGAIDTYEEALKTAPERADIRSNLAAAFVALGRFDEGIRQYTQALETRDDPQIRLNLGLALYKSGRRPEAIPEFQKVLQVQPEHKQATLLLADCLLNEDRSQEVIDLLARREEAFADDLAFAYLLGTAYLNVDDVDRGQVLIDRIFQKGESAEGRLLMGMAYLSKRDYQNAVSELARAVELNPELPSVQLLYGRALLGVSERDRAIRAFRLSLQQEPENFEANLQLGSLYRQDQRFEESLTYLKRAAALRPSDQALRHIMAGTYLGLNRPEDARVLLEGLVKEAPDFIDGHVLLATTYYRLKRKEDGDRERAIVARLTAEQQAKQPGVIERMKELEGETDGAAGAPSAGK